jgi:hypothetical protein
MLHHYRRRRAELVLWEPIDADASGAVFHARLLLADDDKRRCVVKLPPMMRSIKCPVRVSKRLLAGAPDALLLEARNAQRALDAPEARVRDDAEDERAEWQSQPGYTHLHPVVGFRDGVLVSQGADGTIAELAERFDPRTSPGPVWMRVAWQLSEAVTFLFETARLAHVNIRPKHVLFVRDGPSRRSPHVWLSDYSALVDADAASEQRSLVTYYETLRDLFRFYEEVDEQHPVAQMVLQPLSNAPELSAHFYDRLRPWLKQTLEAGLSPI